MPPQLQLTLLNVPPAQDNMACLPRPQHVILSHLYMQRGQVRRWGPLGLGAACLRGAERAPSRHTCQGVDPACTSPSSPFRPAHTCIHTHHPHTRTQPHAHAHIYQHICAHTCPTECERAGGGHHHALQVQVHHHCHVQAQGAAESGRQHADTAAATAAIWLPTQRLSGHGAWCICCWGAARPANRGPIQCKPLHGAAAQLMLLIRDVIPCTVACNINTHPGIVRSSPLVAVSVSGVLACTPAPQACTSRTGAGW